MTEKRVNVWAIRVRRGGSVLDGVEVPINKLPDVALGAFMRALMASHGNLSASELLPYYVNRRLGEPVRQSNWDARVDYDLANGVKRYLCGNPELYVTAEWQLTSDEIEFLKTVRRQNRGS